jgi:hypothetical protein
MIKMMNASTPTPKIPSTKTLSVSGISDTDKILEVKRKLVIHTTEQAMIRLIKLT